jgi:hypothetical protein
LALDQDEVDDRGVAARAATSGVSSRSSPNTAASRASDSTRIVITRAPAAHGMLGAADAVFTLRDKVGQLDAAKHAADSLAALFKQRHDSIEARAARMVDSANAHLTHDSSAALLELTRSRAASEKRRATLDQRMDNQTRLSDTYAGWSTVVSCRRAMFNQVLRRGDLLSIIRGMLLRAGSSIWRARAPRTIAGRRRHDRAPTAGHRRAADSSHRLRSTQRRLQSLASPCRTPSPSRTLSSASCWFVSWEEHPRGDQVEINGVTEVVEIGMFYGAARDRRGPSRTGQPPRHVQQQLRDRGHTSTSRPALDVGRSPHRSPGPRPRYRAALERRSRQQPKRLAEEWR